MTAPTMDSQQGHLGAPDGNGVQNLELPETVKQEIEAAAEYTHVPIGDIEVRVKPQRKWRMSDLRMLRAGDFDGWVESVIHPEDIDAFVEQDPTMEQFERFTEDAARLAGDSLGKSSGRSRSSRPTPRR